MDIRNAIRGALGAAFAAWACLAAAEPAAWRIDTAFGEAGVMRLAGAPEDSRSLVASAAFADGGSIAVGTVDRGGQRDLLLARFDAQGLLDGRFGFAGELELDAGLADDAALAAATLPDGRILVAGQRGGAPFVLRLLPDGALDAGFGVGGFVTPSLLNARLLRINDLAVDAAGRVLALGSVLAAGDPPTAHPVVLRLLSDGALDRGFDGDGVRVLREVAGLGAALAIDAAGRVVLVANGADGYALAALDATGRLDPAFGDGGVSAIPIGAGAIATDLAARGDGFVIAGLNVFALLGVDAAGRPAAAPRIAADALGAWVLRPLADGTLAVAGACRSGGGEGRMVGQLAQDGAWSLDHCASPAGGFSAVRGLIGDASRLVAIGTAIAAGDIGAEVNRFLRATSARVEPAPASPDKRCKKNKFRRRNPAVCGG